MSISVTLSFPESIINKIDRDRGDVNRSKFVLRLVEKAYDLKNLQERVDTKSRIHFNKKIGDLI